MEPIYMNENRYSYLVGSRPRRANAVYVTESPETEFERHVQDLFLTGQTHLQHEEFTLALQKFQDALALIVHTVHPSMPIDRYWYSDLRFPVDASMIDVLSAKSVELLQKTPSTSYLLPANLMSNTSRLSAESQKTLGTTVASGIRVTSFQAAAQSNVELALEAAAQNDWDQAIKSYEAALATVPGTASTIVGAMQHDLAVLNEKSNNRERAQALAQASVKTFETAKATDAQGQALATAAGIFSRSGKQEQAVIFTRSLDQLRSTNNFNDVVTSKFAIAENRAALVTRAQLVSGGTSVAAENSLAGSNIRGAVLASAARAFNFDQRAPELMGLKYLSSSESQKVMTINGTNSVAQLVLDANAVTSGKAFLTSIATTKDIGLLVNWLHPTEFVAYIPHMYFFVIPMSIADCYSGMGNLGQAQQGYVDVLAYPFINSNYEIVKVWTRLAQTLLDQGDQAYRSAKDNVAAFALAKSFYEAIVVTNKSIPAASPLYANTKFAGIAARVTAFVALTNSLSSTENPAISTIVLNALIKLQQIQVGLNFFGFAPNYVPPFSFEYLQNTARYFAQHASQTEQRYIQYKSQAENEEFRREQLNQQAEVARQSVVLEQRGVAEATRGVDVSKASLNYASTQTQNAIDSKTDFNNVRWELAEITELEAWASAASVNGDDQMKLNISSDQGFQYFRADGERRDWVIQRLARQRTRISQELEVARLDRAIASAQAYQAVSQAQVAQAQARVAIAEQRVVVAQLQQRFAEENRDFLDMREFGARLWYEIAQQAKRLTQRYLDMATEIAFLMERAYNAETERNLQVIRYDYQHTSSGNLMGADMLAADIDYFTFDHLTTTKTKKIPVKKTISLADAYPTQFRSLKTAGVCMFETVLADFDREHPGLYLAKIRNVELILVGISGATSIAGTLRNIGVSRFRSSDGAVVERLYPADVMALSQYEIRQDALAFRFNPNDLRLFENNGIDTLWQLHLPLSANDFDFNEILDAHLVLYYDGFFNPALETTIKQALPTQGSASRAFSLKLSFPDELFFLKNQGEAELNVDSMLFPMNQRNPKRSTCTLRLSGQSAVVKNLKLRLTSAQLGTDIQLQADANGEIFDTAAGAPLAALRGKSMLDHWKLVITAADNPALVINSKLDLTGLDDVLSFSDYTFDYR